MVMTIDNFEEKFRDDLRPYWKIFAGRGKTLICSNLELENMDESWDLLANQLSRYDTGTFKVLTFSNPAAPNHSAWETVVKIGNASIANTRITKPQTMDGSYFKMMQHFQAQSDKAIATAVAAADARAKRDMEFMEKMIALKNDNAALAGALEAPNTSMKEQLYSEIIDNVPSIIEGIKDFLKPKIQPVQTAQLGTMGQEAPTAKQRVVDNNIPVTPKRISFDRMAVAAQRIQKAIPEEHINDLLDLIAGFCEQSPQQVKMLLKQLKGE